MFVYLLLALIVVGCDQLTKLVIVKAMNLYDTIPVIDGVFHITSHRNAGAAFGILQDARWFFIVVTVVVIIGILWYMTQIREQKGMLVSLALVLGGAIGNFIDRLLQGEVVDFLDFRMINFPIFNVADSAIVVGVIILLWFTLFSRQTQVTEKYRFEDE
ncbi:signal peptidase II [Numidum massiliense]|uniref:signal peptidase II n=1 Tax=Numidum massiliense TaxID=1522315 RepID=UPI0006D587EE|nr:signal peptidase II [Numidum massiliense]